MATGSDDPRLYGDSFADVYDEWYSTLDHPQTTTAMVDVIRRIAPGPRVLEMGAGTGRIALPLANAGFEVLALDASLPMLDVLTSRVTRQQEVKSLCADMAALPCRTDSVDLALIAYNTFFNLVADGAQDSCVREVARTLRSGGRLVIDAFVPAAPPTTRHHAVSSARSSESEVVLIATRQNGRSARVDGAHLQFTAQGLTARPWAILARLPAEIDAMASAHGLSLMHRVSDWSGAAFDANTGRQISVYELA